MRRRAVHRVGLLLVVVLSVVVGVLVTAGPAQAATRSADGDDDCATQSARALLSPYSRTWTDGYLAYVDPWAKPKVPCTADGQPVSLGPPFGVYEEYPGQMLPPSLWRFGSPCHWWDNVCLDGYQRCGIAGPFSCPDPALQQPFLVSSDPTNPNAVQPLNSFAPLYATTPDTPPTVSSSNPQFSPLYGTTPDSPPTVSSSNPQFQPLYGSTPDTPPTVSSNVPGVVQPSGQSDSSSSSSQSDSSSSSSSSGQIELPTQPDSSSSSSSSGQLELPTQPDSSSSSSSSSSSGQVELPSQSELPQVQSVDPGSSSVGDSGSSSSSGSSSLGSVLSGQ